ncbi:AMP phosphorylase [Nanoarchaeota archaeon]
MKFKVKDVDIATGGTLVCILNKKDADFLDMHIHDRVRLTKGNRSTVAALDIAESGKAVPVGSIGLMEEVLKKLRVKQGDTVKIIVDEKPKSVALIKKKLAGKRLDASEMTEIIVDLVANRLTQVEVTYFVAATYMKGLDLDETVALTKAMINTGEILHLDKHPVIDKHCIGGVPGNRTTMIVVPILVAAGYTVPKTSSRSITSPAGTADTMEVIAKVDHDMKKIKKVVEKTGGCMVWGGAVNMAPADDKIITVEHPLSIDAEGQMLASILAKKGSVSASHVLIDIPVGRGAKVKNMKKAVHLEKMFKKIAKKIGIKVKVAITDGSQPIGNGIGPGLEARDVLYVLRNDERAPLDLRNKALLMAGAIMNAWPLNKKMKRKGFYQAKQILESGKAFEAFERMVVAQGKKTLDPDKIKLGKFTFDVKARCKGKIQYIDNKSIARIAKAAGTPHDKESGIDLYFRVGDKVKKGDKIFTVYAKSKKKLDYAKKIVRLYDGVVVS